LIQLGDGSGKGGVGRFFAEQKYGIALPTASPHREDINRALLKLKENRKYDEIYAKWFE
jgi:polar amino acid transport system substrate-binding protein